MKFHIDIKDSRQLANVIAALKIIDPSAEVVEENFDLCLIVEYSANFFVRVWSPDLPAGENVWEFKDQDILDPRYQESDYPKRMKELIRLGIISLLGRKLHKSPVWGSLSAVRPTKIFHHLRERGFSIGEIRQKLLTIYALEPGRVELLIEIGSHQEKFFKPQNTVSLYIGIPFCPSRCRYCSFAAVSLETHGHLVRGFLEGLHQEIAATQQLIREWGFVVESIYIGGGTPTSLNTEDFSSLLKAVKEQLITEHTGEFTVEAGRPETIDIEKLKVMKNVGVTRVCVNPQSMHDQTLQLIGRQHSVAEFLQAATLVQQTGDFILNMDLILGLPGENGTQFLESCYQVLQLEPDNITIHTLAPKRASAWHKDFAALELTDENDIDKAWSQALALLKQEHYIPYYIYRQRSILADQANIGLAKPGTENIYNIQMMEERQTIFGLGGGAITKWVFGPDYQLIRLQNPKCPATYRRDIQELIVKKAQQTRLLLG
jgi:oxygen-independent coproporphyrinogen-3 oxidase